MITTYKIPYKEGEFRIGWASWDDGSMTARSIKYAYKDASGKISRGSPELPLDMLMDMLLLAAEQGEIRFDSPLGKETPIGKCSNEELLGDQKKLKSALLLLQRLTADLPWANFGVVYNQIGGRYEKVKAELQRRARQ